MLACPLLFVDDSYYYVVINLGTQGGCLHVSVHSEYGRVSGQRMIHRSKNSLAPAASTGFQIVFLFVTINFLILSKGE
jgi:hypothetical protein